MIPIPRLRSLRTRLVLGTGAMLLPLLTLAVVGYLLFQSVTVGMDQVVNRVFNQLVPVAELNAAVQRNRYLVGDAVIRHKPAAVEEYGALTEKIDNAFGRLDGKETGLRTDLVRDLEHARATWHHIARAGSEHLAQSSTPPGAADSIRSSYGTLAQELRHIHTDILQEIAFQRTQARRAQRHVIVLIGAMALVGLLVAIAAAVVLARTILTPLADLNRAAERFGAGDLQFRVERLPRHELGRVARTFNDMADTIERHQMSLQHMAIRDALTGLYNRREFKARLGVELERARRYSHPFAVLLIDIDHFKAVNDTYGHPAGDQVLVAVAGALRDGMRPVDTVARYGGEEFAVILAEIRAEAAVAMAERLREQVAALPVGLGADEVRVTISIGVAAFPQHGGRTDTLMQQADQALYAAKGSGRDRVVLADPDADSPLAAG